MPDNGPRALNVHPLVAALETAGEPAVMLRGLLGTSDAAVVRLYEALDVSAYVEIPRDKVVYLETVEHGETGEVRAFVAASAEVLEVRKRRLRPGELMSATIESGARPRFPPLQPRPTFWTCAAGCEGVFASTATQILIDEAQALQAPPAPQAVLLAQIEQRKMEAKRALLACLSSCISRYGAPPFMTVPDDSPTGFHLERFLAGRISPDHRIEVLGEAGMMPAGLM